MKSDYEAEVGDSMNQAEVHVIHDDYSYSEMTILLMNKM